MTKPVAIMKTLIMTLAVVIIAGGFSPLLAQGAKEGAKAPAWIPVPAKATGGKCDADPSWMRKWHMTKLDHKRDATMHQGIRTKEYSLKRCITCHAVKDEAGKFVTVKDERHFCRTCHDYAAVTVDCFTCHASRPTNADGSAAADPHKGKPAHAGSTETSDTMLAALKKFVKGEGK